MTKGMLKKNLLFLTIAGALAVSGCNRKTNNATDTDGTGTADTSVSPGSTTSNTTTSEGGSPNSMGSDNTQRRPSSTGTENCAANDQDCLRRSRSGMGGATGGTTGSEPTGSGSYQNRGTGTGTGTGTSPSGGSM